ncbi:MAG: DUF4906 domain-containing protein [Prevotella sp.]|nr:DUF4906 domain-containing protein [Prevotella sp.]
MRKIEKLTKTLLAFAMMAGFAACSSDSDTGSNTPQGDRYLTLSISTKSVMRTTMIDSDPGSASEDAINSLTVGIFNDAGDAVKIEEFASSAFDTSSGTIQVVITNQGLVDGNKVIAVANAPAGTFNGCTNITSFKAKTMSIDDALANSATEKITNFPMVGNSTIAATTGNVNFTASVTLYHMVAKVSLAPITIDFSGNTLYPTATFTPEELFLYSVPASQAYWYTPGTGATDYYSGESSATTKKEYLGSGAATIDIAKSHYLYALPNSETGDKATKLVIKGTFKATPTSTGSTIYYPIYLDYVAPATAGAAGTAAAGDLPGYASELSLTARTPKVVYANDNYKINVTIKSIGSTSPDSDLDPQQVTVSVTVAPWTDLTQNTTFN